MRNILKLNLKNKILFSTLAVIVLVSVCIALLARYILISSLTRELEYRGLGIAQSIADRSAGLILTGDKPNLISLAFEAMQVGERRALIAYVYILDAQQEVLASTFLQPFPDFLRQANIIPEGVSQSVKTLSFLDEPAYDIAVPVKEGLYDVGSVHVGLSKEHIDNVVAQLRLAFLGFLAGIVVVMFFISDKISRNITRPIAQLIKVSDAISRDNLDIKADLGPDRKVCWELRECPDKTCPAYENEDAACWNLNDTLCPACPSEKFPEKINACRSCEIYRQRHSGDEVVQLADSFENMVWHIKTYRDQLRRSQQKYLSLFHSGPDPIFVLDWERYTILDANPIASEMFGYTHTKLMGMDFAELAPEFIDVCRQAFHEGDHESMAGCVLHPKMLCYKKNREPFYVNAHACGATYEEKRAIIVSTNDITDMIEKDAQLIQASKMKSLGEMSAGIAHEVNQPLNAIKIGCEYLGLMIERGGLPPVDQVGQVVGEISKQVDRAAEIITTLREFGRKADMTKEKFDIGAAVKDVLNILRQQLVLYKIELSVDLAERLPRILGHKNRLEQVLFNLLTNARDAIVMKEEVPGADGERRIAISTALVNGRVACRVADTGIGIIPEKREKIFEPFYTTKQIGKGMGLGLAISYGIVKDYHGDIEVSSAPGKGAAFTLTFPPADA